MPAQKGVVTAGSWCCDHNKLVDRWPSEDSLATIIAEERHGGGSACNMAIDLKKLDPDFLVETIGIIGEDEDGRLLVAEADTPTASTAAACALSLAGARTTPTPSHRARQGGARI